MRKNKNSKRIVAGVLALGIIAGAIGIGAYLSDTEVKKDVYTVGNVQAEIVSVGDMELDNVGALLPGTVHQYERAAMNTGINDAYVFMSLTIPYEMVGVSEDDGTQIGERVRQLFIPGVDGGYIGSEWKLVDVGYIGQYEIEDNGQYCGEHDAYSAVVGDTITYVYGYIGDNADGSLKALASGETTSNLVETMKLTNLYHVDKIDGEVSTKLYAIQSANVNGGLTDVNGVWAVINSAISGEAKEASTLTYSINNTRTGDAVGYAPLKLVDENGNVVATSVANANGSGQFENVPAGDYNIQTAVGDLVLTGGSTGYGLRNKTASITITGEDSSVALGLETPVNTLVQGPVFNMAIPNDVTSIEFVAMPQTYGLSDRTVPADAIDVSEAADGSVMAWVEDTTFYVVALDGGMIYANPNCKAMFKDKTNLTHIGTDNLSTLGVYNGHNFFSGCGDIGNDFKNFDLSNMRGMIGAFAYCSWLTEYVIPEGTEYIPADTFMYCTNLSSVIIPNSIKRIENSAFSNCSSLTSIVLPEGLEAISDTAFMYAGLTSVHIPASVTELKMNMYVPFFANNNLTEITVDPANENYVAVDGVLFTKDMKTLIQYPAANTVSSYEIPEGVEKISRHAFYNANYLTEIIIPEGVTSIGYSAFGECHKLSSISIPTSVTEIGEHAFNNTKWLLSKMDAGESVIINGIVVYTPPIKGDYRIPDGTTEIPEKAFYNNYELTSVYIPASVTSIGASAFEWCGNLTTVTFEDGSQLKTIGSRAFAFCETLTSIELPDSVETIEDTAFFRCYELSSVTLSDNLISIGSSAFDNCEGLISITIPASVTSISGNVFTDCTSLVAINVHEDNEVYFSDNGVLYKHVYYGEYYYGIELVCYPNGKTDKTYIVPENVKDIGHEAFGGYEFANTYLEEITLPASVSNFGNYCFMNCTNLKTINYCGTQAQWNQVYFANDCFNGVHADFKVVYDYVAE